MGPSGVGKSSLINALRSNGNNCDSDATEVDNWFEPVCFISLVLVFVIMYFLLCISQFVILITCVYLMFSDFRQQVV